jgi:hypothetical protein
MIKTLNIVKKKDAAIPGRHGSQGSMNVEAVYYTGLQKITSTETTAGPLFRDVFHQVIERYNRQCALTQVHQDSVDGQSMEPSGEGGVATKQRNSPVDLEKCFLREIFGEGEIPDHAHANCENTSFVLQIEL